MKIEDRREKASVEVVLKKKNMAGGSQFLAVLKSLPC